MDLVGIAAVVSAFLALVDLANSPRSRIVWAVLILSLAIALTQLGFNIHVPR